ncbi:MAG: YihY/virulence factor BrkB family protein [Gaiellales bacterium]
MSAPRDRRGLDRIPQRPHVLHGHAIIRNFFADRCTHLAAMVAYYALLSLLPLLAIALALIGVFGQPNDKSTLIHELGRIFPGTSVANLVELVRGLQRNATALGALGGASLVWTSLGFLSALESALNIIYGVPNRPFVRQKLLVFTLVGSGLVLVIVSLIAATAAQTFLDEHASGLLHQPVWSVTSALVISTTVAFGFTFTVYRLLPNTLVSSREVLPGTIVATILLQASFTVLPIYLKFASTLPALKAFGGIVLLLTWLYLMGNIVMLGAEINWWYGRGRPLVVEESAREDEELGHS